MEVKFNFHAGDLDLTKLNWRVFWISAVAAFIFSALQMFGFQPLQLLSPLAASTEQTDAMVEVRSKIENVRNTYQIKEKTALIPAAQAAAGYDNASAYAVIEYDSGNVLLSKNLNEKLSIASLTKVLTAIVALDLAREDDLIEISSRAAATIPTKIGVIEGEKMTVKELLSAVLLTSANDAAQAIADGIDARYSEPVFIKAMNEKARFIGLKNSHFENPQGFDGETHFSTVEDLAVITHYALTHYPLIAELASKDYMLLPQDRHHKKFDLYNWNGLLGVYPEVKGVKIGNTARAGITTIVLSSREGKTLVAILLGAPGVLERDLWAAQLLDAGYEATLNLPRVDVTEKMLRDKYATWKFWG